MIWPILTITLYTIISGIALFLICDGVKREYYDIRNIITAICWPVVLAVACIKWSWKKISYKPKEVKDGQ
jgi:hypothetical protein